MLAWFKRRRRQKLRAQPFPPEWIEYLRANVRHADRLDDAQRQRLRGDVAVLVAEKNWEGCGGLEMTDEIRVTTAALVACMTLGFDNIDCFDHVLSVLVYPTPYVAQETQVNQAGVVLEVDSSRLGEAWHRGPVVLSWPDVLAAARKQAGGHNLVFHEFAHQLDLLNGMHADGIPPIDDRAQYERFDEVTSSEFRKLIHDCRHGRNPLLDCYGATDRGEFFAVATEAFFERPAEMQQRYPRLYDVLREYYRQHPAEP